MSEMNFTSSRVKKNSVRRIRPPVPVACNCPWFMNVVKGSFVSAIDWSAMIVPWLTMSLLLVTRLPAPRIVRPAALVKPGPRDPENTLHLPLDHEVARRRRKHRGRFQASRHDNDLRLSHDFSLGNIGQLKGGRRQPF